MAALTIASPIRRLPAAALVVLMWFTAALVAGATGVFTARDGAPPVWVGLAAAVPPIGAVAVLAASDRARSWVGGLDLRFLTMLQTWRVAGLAFVALAVEGALPRGFALPAGYGDILIGMTAPVVAMFVVGGGLAARRIYYGWVLVGVADLVVAITLGLLHSDSPIGVLGGPGVDTDLMGTLPMSLIPTFGVPLALTLHVMALVAARRSGTGFRVQDAM